MAADKPKDKPQIFPNPYVTFCDVFNCTTRAKWFVGRPDAPYTTCLNLCDECAKEVLRLIPAELLEHVPLPEGMVLITEDRLDELEKKEVELEDMYKADEYEHGPAMEEYIAGIGTSDSTTPIELRDQQEQEPAGYTCDFPGCGRVFGSPQALLAHSRVHKGEGK